MFISDFAIRRPIITVVAMIALVVFGIAALAQLQTDEFPDIDAPIVFIGIVYPGASPDQVEREVVDRARGPHLRHLRARQAAARRRPTASRRSSSSSSSTSRPTRRRRTCATRSPRCARSSRRRSSSRSSSGSIRHRMPIVSLALTSLTLTPAQLTQIADQTIGGELRSIAGVAQVNVARRRQRDAQRRCSIPARLAAAGVGVDQVVQRAPRAEPRRAGRPA